MRRRGVTVGQRGFGVLAATVAMLTMTACSGVTTGPGATPAPTVARATFDSLVFQTGNPNAQPGRWTGTITLHGVINVDKTEDGHSDLPPENIYYETWTTTEVTQLDATDTFTITAADDPDVTYGIHAVDLTGTAANSGTTLERYLMLTNKRNSGCTWKEENGEETSGSWSGAGDSLGKLRFSEDGEYSIEIRADTSGPNGESAPEPELPHHTWLKYSDISANCEVNEAPFDLQEPRGPIVQWVSSSLGQADVKGEYSRIEGKLNASNPGSVVDGTTTWELSYPEGFTMTITWHLVHDSPIVLPHA